MKYFIASAFSLFWYTLAAAAIHHFWPTIPYWPITMGLMAGNFGFMMVNIILHDK